MTHVTCPSCGAALPDGARACDYCGRRVAGAPATKAVPPEQQARHHRVLQLAVVACGVVLALGILVAILLAAQRTQLRR